MAKLLLLPSSKQQEDRVSMLAGAHLTQLMSHISPSGVNENYPKSKNTTFMMTLCMRVSYYKLQKANERDGGQRLLAGGVFFPAV